MSDTISNLMKGTANVIAQTTNDLFGEITVATREELPGEINVIGNRTKINGTAEIIPAPIDHKDILPMYDAYVRSDFDAFSYGSYTTLHTGKLSSGADTQGLIYFNLNQWFPKNTTNLIKAVLRLYCVSKGTSSINIYKADKAWQENNVTYINKPAKENLLAAKAIGVDDNYIDIDLSDYFKDSFKNDSDNGFIIQVSDESSPDKAFYSKEADPALAPKLMVDYYDLNDIIETNDLSGEISVASHKADDLSGEIDVRALNVTTNDDLSAEITISKENQLGEINVLGKTDQSGEITVAGPGITDQLGEIGIKTTKTNDLSAEILLTDHKDDKNDLSGEIIISKENQLAEITVSTKNDLNGEINVIKPGMIEQSGEILVSTSKNDKADQSGEITVYSNGEAEVNGEILVDNQKTTSNDLSGEIIISKENQLAEITVGKASDQSGEISVKKNDISDQSGEITIKAVVHDDNYGEINVAGQGTDEDQSGEITVAGHDKNDLSSEITVVDHKDDKSDLSGEIIISKENQPGEITVSTNSDQSGEINVKKNGLNDQPGEISVYSKGETEVNGEILVKAGLGCDLHGEIKVIKEKFRGFTQIINA